MMRFVRRTAALLSIATLLASSAAAQLDLPSKPPAKRERAERPAAQPRKKPRGDTVPHLVCSICYERNYTTKIDYGAENGLQTARCSVCRRDTPHKLPPKKGKQQSLDLPIAPRSTKRGESAPPLDPGARTKPSTERAESPRVPSSAAELILREVRRVRKVDDPIATSAAVSLNALGDAGLVAARAALESPHAPTLMVGVRVLLMSGDAADAELVAERLRSKLPTRAAAAIIPEWVERDPVRATPRALIRLLDHPQSPMRTAAERTLSNGLKAEWFPELVEMLSSERSDTRLRTLNLLGRLDDPRLLDVCLQYLADSNAKVAWRAVQTLTDLDDSNVDFELLSLAFKDQWILRQNAYALLALIEREDTKLEPILTDSHVSGLLPSLDASDPFVVASCASALAGIGFRSELDSTSEWLNGPVPELLVATISGQYYFDDYSSVLSPALRRLKLISGVSFGTDGPKWTDWWLENKDTFHASRAVIPVTEDAASSLLVTVHGSANSGSFVLVGEGQAESEGIMFAGEVIYLTANEASDFITLLRREGVLGLERLPGVRGGETHRGRSLDVQIGNQGKRFVFGPGASEPWFERVVAMAESLVDRNRWQRFPDPTGHGTRLALWREQAEWWADVTHQEERPARLKELVMQRVRWLVPEERDIEVDELTRLFKSVPATEDDFEALLPLLAEEPHLTPRARSLVALCEQSAGLLEDEVSAAAIARGERLVTVLHDNFSGLAAEAISRVLLAGGPQTVRQTATDERPLMRAIAAKLLAENQYDPEAPELLALFSDPVSDVRVAAIAAAGEYKVEAARTDLLIFAQMADPELRGAALEAAGKLGGEGTNRALIAGLTENDPYIKVAAVRGLAHLADASTAPLLVSLLKSGRQSDLYEPARAGLLRMGEGAFDALFVAMRGNSEKGRRESSLLLAEQLVAEAAPSLMRLLTENPTDRQVRSELAILTCVDFDGSGDVSSEYWNWWDSVVHDDAWLWFIAAMEARGRSAPPRSEFERGGTTQALRFLFSGMRSADKGLRTRAQRELERMIERSVGDPPIGEGARAAWLAALEDVLIRERE